MSGKSVRTRDGSAPARDWPGILPGRSYHPAMESRGQSDHQSHHQSHHQSSHQYNGRNRYRDHYRDQYYYQSHPITEDP